MGPTQESIRHSAVTLLPYYMALLQAEQQAEIQLRNASGELSVTWRAALWFIRDKRKETEKQIAQEMGLVKFECKGELRQWQKTFLNW